jgi:hypothetical protein
LQAFIVDGTGIEPWIIIAVVMFSTHGLPAINGLALQYIPTLPTIHSSVLWASQEVFEHYFLPFRASVQFMLLLLILVGLYFISVLLCFLFGLGMIERMLTQASQEIRWDNRIFGYVLCLFSLTLGSLAIYALLMFGFPFLLLLYHLFYTFGSLNAGTLSAAARAIGMELCYNVTGSALSDSIGV